MRSLFVIILVLISQTASAYFVTGNKLIENMREFEKFSHAEQWVGINHQKIRSYLYYVLGVYESLEAMSVVCTPDDINQGQVGEAVAEYIKAHPKSGDVLAFSLVSSALLKKFPC